MGNSESNTVSRDGDLIMTLLDVSYLYRENHFNEIVCRLIDEIIVKSNFTRFDNISMCGVKIEFKHGAIYEGDIEIIGNKPILCDISGILTQINGTKIKGWLCGEPEQNCTIIYPDGFEFSGPVIQLNNKLYVEQNQIDFDLNSREHMYNRDNTILNSPIVNSNIIMEQSIGSNNIKPSISVPIIAEEISSNNISSKEDNDLCCVCFTNKKNCLVLPCKHALFCASCISIITSTTNKCPTCRVNISNTISGIFI